MKVYIVNLQRIPESKIVATGRKLLHAQEAAQEDATSRGYGKIGVWSVPASDDWKAHGLAVGQSGSFYEITQHDV